MTGKGTYIEGQDGEEQTTEIEIASKMTLESEDNLTLRGNRRTEVLDVPFRIRSDVEIPGGRHEFNQFAAVLGTNRGRPLSGTLTVSSGSFFHGDRTQLKAELRWSTGSHHSRISPK